MRRDSKSRVPDAFIDEVLARTDIEAVIGARVQLKKAGASLVACCPFHTEKSPSFSVSPSKGFYHCFGCGASGSALTFLIEHDGTPFREAISELASLAGMAMPAVAQGPAAQPPADYSALFETNAQAYRWFRHTLKADEVAKDYLRLRGVTQDTLRRFLIGAAPDSWQGLREAFPDYDSNGALRTTGLVKVNEEKGRSYDLFRGRVIFGIRDTRGRIIGFGGRSIAPSDAAKYINSPESPIFDKSSVLFGLYEAREAIRKEKFAFVAEGYMDVAMMAQYGVCNAVAGMGTAFTAIQAERLLTQTKSVVFCFDGDKAGRDAARKACKVMLPLLDEQLDVRVLVLPGDMDPDEMLRSEGPAAFMSLAKNAPTMVRHLIEAFSAIHDLSSPEGVARFITELSAYIELIPSRMLREAYEDELMAAAGQTPGTGMPRATKPSWAGGEKTTLWQRIGLAAQSAPDVAFAHRDHIIACLDPEAPDELELIDLLQGLSDSAVSGSTEAELLVASDLLIAAVGLIVEERRAAYETALKAQYLNDELDINTYLDLAMRD